MFLGCLFIIIWILPSDPQNVVLSIFNFYKVTKNVRNGEFAAYSAYFDPKSAEITILGFKKVDKSPSAMICVTFYRSVPNSDELSISKSDGNFQLINIATKNSHEAFYLRCPFR